MKDKSKEEELFVGRLKLFPDEKREILGARKSGRIDELLVTKENELMPEIWLRQNYDDYGAVNAREMNERIVGKTQRARTTILQIESPERAQKAGLLQLMKITTKKPNYERSNNYLTRRCSSLRESRARFATPILLLISLILPLASSNSTPPSPQTIEGKRKVVENWKVSY